MVIRVVVWLWTGCEGLVHLEARDQRLDQADGIHLVQKLLDVVVSELELDVDQVS